jgi:hypothetical protein
MGDCAYERGEHRYTVEKTCGRVYCGNAFCDTIGEAFEFAADGFCDRATIYDTKTGDTLKIKITITEG